MRMFSGYPLLLALPLAACSIPDQRHVTHLDLVDIVNNIRCEASEALASFRPRKPGEDHAIALGFDFNTEINKNIGGSSTFAWPIGPGTFSLALDAGVDKKRWGDEKVTVTETFKELQGLPCEHIRSLRQLSYPIVGRVGMKETIGKYLELMHISTADVTSFSRTLRFTLKMKAGASPQWDLKPIGPLVKAQIDVDLDRQDFHEVKIAIEPVVNKTAAQKIAEKTVYVRILSDARGGGRELGEPGVRGSGIGPLPSATDLAKQRARERVLEGRINDTYKQIERQLGTPR